jgi:hypothetical protein
MSGSSDRRVDRLLNSLVSEVKDHSEIIDALCREMQGVRSAQKEIGKKLDALAAIANEKKEVQRIEAISDVGKNDKAFKTIAVVTSCLTFAVVFAVLLWLDCMTVRSQHALKNPISAESLGPRFTSAACWAARCAWPRNTFLAIR